jgi:hypothetical protein
VTYGLLIFKVAVWCWVCSMYALPSSNTQRMSGTNDQAVVIDDAADRATVCIMKTGSDVFAVTQDNVRFRVSVSALP